MKAVIIADSLQGGLGALAIEHALRLSEGFDVVLIAPLADAHLAPDKVKLALVELPLNFLQALRAGAVRAIRTVLRSEKPNIVHAHGIRSFALARLAGAKPWVTLHGFGQAPGAVGWHTAARRGFLRALPVINRGRAFSVSPDVPTGWTFLPHASPRLRQLEVVGPGQSRLFAWVGRFDTQKRPDLFIEALAKLRGSASGVMFGDGPLTASMRDLIEKTQAPVEIVGQVEDLSSRLQESRAVVLLSYFEGVPFAIEEAMWMGKPVIVSRLPGNQWLAGDCALYADTLDETVQAMRALLDLDVAHIMGMRSAARVRRMVGAEDPWPTLEDMYRKALSG